MIGWVDASSGASGDMLLGALVGAGVPLRTISEAVAAVAPERIELKPEPVMRNGFAATLCHVDVADSTTQRTWADIEKLLAEAVLSEGVRGQAITTFERLAAAEAKVHGTETVDAHFHEVGALDSIADVVGVCAGIEHLGLAELVVSPIAVGSGTVHGAHGTMPVPPPAVAELLRGVPTYSGPIPMEMCTPTGAALLVSHATSFGPQPTMSTHEIGVGAGSRDPAGYANVLRLFVGEPWPRRGRPAADPGAALLIETNVDDLDPRLWPNVIGTLLAAGASDAWLTPILMKKGRPAHTLSALVSADAAERVRDTVFRETSTIGVRETPVGKHALERRMTEVHIDGYVVRVKLALRNGSVVNAQPEYDDVAAAAEATGRPVKDVLSEATAASRDL